MTATADLGVELLAAGAGQDPYPLYDRIRSVSPVYWSDAIDAWLVTGYAEARAIVDDPAVFSNEQTRGINVFKLAPERRAELPLLDMIASTPALAFADPPLHTFHRDLIVRPLTPRALVPRRAWLDERCEALANRMAASPAPDLLADFSLPLSIAAVVEVFGGAPEAAPFYLELSQLRRDFFHAIDPDWETALAAEQNFARFKEHVLGLIEEKRSRPDASLLTSLITPTEDGRLPSDDEIVFICYIFLGAAFETTWSAIGTAIYGLLATGQSELVRDDPELVQAAFDEAIRWHSPAQRVFRRAAEDVEVAGRPVRAGQILWVQIGAANRDSAVFDRPDEFDVRRDVRGHLAFSHGIHFCPGAGFGRMEAVAAITHLLSRFPGLRLVDGWQPRWKKFPGARILEALPLELGDRAI